MRSEVTFVMHPEDESEFANAIALEPGTVFVNGPSWPTPEPPIVTDLQIADNYLMIWNPAETPPLSGKHHQNKDAEFWYCQNEFMTIQFLRSGFQYGEPFLFEGRIAICTTDRDKSTFHAPSAPLIERRFLSLRKVIKKTYTNKVLIWQNTSLPRSKTNPSKLSATVWVGPRALRWLREDPKNRWVQQFRNTLPGAYLLDLVG
jgi:hypothetical protein